MTLSTGTQDTKLVRVCLRTLCGFFCYTIKRELSVGQLSSRSIATKICLHCGVDKSMTMLLRSIFLFATLALTQSFTSFPLLGSVHSRPVKSVTRLMGLKVAIRIVGRKSSEKWLETACDMYLQRLRSANFEVDTMWHKNDDALIKGVSTDYENKHTVVLLDPLGTTCTSEKLADKMYRWLEDGGSRLVFVIGGAEGLPTQLKCDISAGKNKGPILLSLSQLTFTHQFARLVLIEQIYRATEIRKGSSYNR